VGTTSNYQLWNFSKSNPTGNFSYEFLDTSSSFVPPTTSTSPATDNDSLKIINVGNYLYTAFATSEQIYDPSTGNFNNYYSLYFAFRKLVSSNPYSDSGRSGWVKRKVFSVPQTSGLIRFISVNYANSTAYITFTVDNTTRNPSLYDFYCAYSLDKKNWSIINIDKKLQGASDNIHPLFPMLLIGSLNGTSDTFHLVFINWTNNTGNNRFSINYVSTNSDFSSFSNVQDLTSSINLRCQTLRDFDAVINNNELHMIISGGLFSSSWTGLRDKLVYLKKHTLVQMVDFYPTGNNTSIEFVSASLQIGDLRVHVVSSVQGQTTTYYLRRPYTAPSGSFTFTTFTTGGALSINTFYQSPYLHVSLFDTNSNPSLSDLKYYRINPVTLEISQINNLSIDDNLTSSSSSVDSQLLLATDNIVNGQINGIVIDSVFNHLHFISYNSTASSLGEIIYTDPSNASNPMPSAGRFNTVLIFDAIPYFRSVSTSSNGTIKAITYTDNNTGSETAIPTTNSINDFKININNFITEIDGNRRFDTNNSTDIDYSRSCGFYNDVKVVNNTIYVAYSELISGNLRLRLARSNDNGHSWQIETATTSNSARDINLEVGNNFINIIHRDNLGNLIITKKHGSTFNNYTSSLFTPNYNIRTFLDTTSGRLHIISFSVQSGFPSNCYYIVFDNSTNSFVIQQSLNMILTYATIFTSIGPYGDIFVDSDGTVYIAVVTRRIGQTTDGLDLLTYKNGAWQNPIRIPPSSPINYLVNSIRITKWEY
jgi:hypothetical protein